MSPERPRRAVSLPRRLALGIATVAGVAALAAGGPARALVAGTFFVPPGFERIAMADSSYAARKHRQITQIGPWSRTDYARFEGVAGQGEVLFKTANHGAYVLSHPPGLARLASGWNHLHGQIRRWGRTWSRRGWVADTVYRRATLKDGRICVVFSGEGQPVTLDPEARPGLVYFGYFCARHTSAMTDRHAGAIVASIRLVYDRRTPRPEQAPSREAEAIAKGSLATRTGNARFPVPLATPYIENDGSRERP